MRCRRLGAILLVRPSPCIYTLAQRCAAGVELASDTASPSIPGPQLPVRTPVGLSPNGILPPMSTPPPAATSAASACINLAPECLAHVRADVLGTGSHAEGREVGESAPAVLRTGPTSTRRFRRPKLFLPIAEVARPQAITTAEPSFNVTSSASARSANASTSLAAIACAVPQSLSIASRGAVPARTVSATAWASSER